MQKTKIAFGWIVKSDLSGGDVLGEWLAKSVKKARPCFIRSSGPYRSMVQKAMLPTWLPRASLFDSYEYNFSMKFLNIKLF